MEDHLIERHLVDTSLLEKTSSLAYQDKASFNVYQKRLVNGYVVVFTVQS